MANLFDTLNLGGAEGVVTLPYGVCSTAAATAAKTVATTSKKFALATGATILVRFTITNTATAPTLSVNDTDPKAIRYRGATAANHLVANRVYLFVYDGTDWELVGDINTDSNTTYSAGNGLTLSSTTFNVGAGTGISVAADTVSLSIPYSMSSDTSTVPAAGAIVWYYGN